jgi:hypothetical protein
MWNEVDRAPMSSQSSHATGVEWWAPSCTFCESPLTEQLLALQSYPSAATSPPAGVPDDGGLTLCPDCASEVVELLDSWRPHEQPPVAEDRSIGEGYREIAAACSFCMDSCAGTVLGVELYRRVGDELPAYANYTLCDNCQSVFGEFLRNVRHESAD